MIAPPAPRLGRSTRGVAATIGLVVLLSGLTALLPAPAGAAGAVPYTDAKAQGSIALCDQSGHSVDHGSTTDKPFVWSAVTSTAAPAEYAGDGKTATLFAFQPRKGVAPGEWSGQLLTASGHYTNTAHPKAQATTLDGPLADFLDTYPAIWDGFVQLRIYLGAPGLPAYTQHYATADLLVTGDTWKVVRGGDTGCDAGKSTSLEDLVPKATPTTVPGAKAPGASTGAGGAGSTGAAGAAVTLPAAATAASLPHRGGHGPTAVTALALLVALVALGGWWWLRRQRHLADAEISPPTQGTQGPR